MYVNKNYRSAFLFVTFNCCKAATLLSGLKKKNHDTNAGETFSVTPLFVRPGVGGRTKSEVLFSFTPGGVQSLISIAPPCDG